MNTPLLSPDAVRMRFSRAMSAVYRGEVPQYSALLELVAQVNCAGWTWSATAPSV